MSTRHFFNGATYEELQQLTGEAPREVCFTLPRGMAAMLRKIPGFEKYDETVHCLECIKPGTGSKDAPRAFSSKLARVTRDVKLGLVPTTYDPELEVKHASINGRRTIVLMVAKHVDDLKVAGTRAEVDLLLRQL